MDIQEWSEMKQEAKVNSVKEVIRDLMGYVFSIYLNILDDDETASKASQSALAYLKDDNVNKLVSTIDTEIGMGIPGSIEVRIAAHIINDFNEPCPTSFDSNIVDTDIKESLTNGVDNGGIVWISTKTGISK